MVRLAQKYKDDVAPALMKQFGYGSPMAVPRVTKVVINMGVGDAIADAKLLDQAVDELSTLAGQRPAITRARKSISNFKLREGVPVGASVTLRGARMWEFFDRLVALAIPRIRDFRGLNPKGFDGHGNYSFGVTEQLIFPEIDYDKISTVRGMDITFVTSAENDDHGKALMESFGFPFRRDQAGV